MPSECPECGAAVTGHSFDGDRATLAPCGCRVSLATAERLAHGDDEDPDAPAIAADGAGRATGEPEDTVELRIRTRRGNLGGIVSVYGIGLEHAPTFGPAEGILETVLAGMEDVYPQEQRIADLATWMGAGDEAPQDDVDVELVELEDAGETDADEDDGDEPEGTEIPLADGGSVDAGEIRAGDLIRLPRLGAELEVDYADGGTIETLSEDVLDPATLQDCIDDGTVEVVQEGSD